MRSFQTNFLNGQISPKLAAQTRSKVYGNAARELTNAEVLQQGGAQRRPGSRVRATLIGDSRIVGHVYNRSEAVLLALSAGRLRIYSPTGAQLAEFTGQPWTGDTKWLLTWEKFGNVTIFCDQSFRPVILTRTGPGAWSIDVVNFRNPFGLKAEPYHKFVAEEVTLTPSDFEGPVTITSSAPVFNGAHIGTRLRIQNATATITARASSTSISATLSKRLEVFADPNPFSVIVDQGRCTVVLADHGLFQGDTVTISEANSVGGVDPNGTYTVLKRLSRDRFTILLVPDVDFSEVGGGPSVAFTFDAPTKLWKEAVFSDVHGWPQAVCVHQGRLWLGGSTDLADAAFASRPQSLFDFEAGEGAPDDGVAAINETQTNAIRHFVSADDLIVLGDAGEAVIPSRDAPIDQGNVRGLPATRLGSSYVRPLPYDGAILFVDVMGHHIYEVVYSEEMTGYVSTPLSSLAPELIVAPLAACRFKGSAESATPTCFWSMGDGTAAVFVSRRAEGAAAWGQWRTRGTYRSFTALNERLYATVTRTIGGVATTLLEEFDFGRAWRADASYPMTGSGALAWTGCPLGANIEIEVIDAVTDRYVGRFTTNGSGGFALPVSLTSIRVGLPFAFVLETLPPALALADGETFSDVQAISRVVTSLHETTFCTVDGETVVARTAEDVLEPIEPISGPIETRQLGSGRDPTVRIVCDLPERCTVLGLLVEVELTVVR